MPEVVNPNGGGGNITNYSVSGAKKRIYHSSKEPLAGYVKLELENGKVTYQRFVDGLVGNITYLAMQDGEYGKKLKVFLSEIGETSALQVSVDKAEYRAFIDAMYNVDFSKLVQISFYEGKGVNDPTKKYQNCYVCYPDELVEVDGKMKPKRAEFLDKKDCPQGVQRKKGWDFSDQEDWYYERMEELIERFNKYKNSQPINKSVAQAGQAKTKVTEDVEVEEGELPF